MPIQAGPAPTSTIHRPNDGLVTRPTAGLVTRPSTGLVVRSSGFPAPTGIVYIQ